MSAATAPEPSVAHVRASSRLRGELRVPGDKSVSHRALILAALAAGESRIEGAGDGADVRSTAGIVAALGATVARSARRGPDGRLPGRLARRRRPARAGRRPRLRQLRDEPAADERRARRPADDLHARWRCVVAWPSGGSYHRTAALDGRRASRTIERLPTSTDRDRSYPAPGHRRHDVGAERTGEVGDPAGGAASGWGDDGSRVDRDSRSHGTDAAGAGRAGRADGRAGWLGGLDDPGRVGCADDDGTGPGRRLGGGVLARRGRDPPRCRAPPAGASASTRPGAR